MRRTADCAVWPAPLVDESLTNRRICRCRVHTRQPRRVTAKIRHLADVFAIAFARTHAEEAGGIPARIAFDSWDYEH